MIKRKPLCDQLITTDVLLVGCNHTYSMRPLNWMLHRSHFTYYRICSLFLLQVHVEGSEEGAVGGEKLDNDRKMEILKNRRRSRKKGVVEQ